jgi:hypothetical protein
VPDVAVYEDDAVLAAKQPPQAVGGHQATDTTAEDDYRLAGHGLIQPIILRLE